MSMAIKMLVSPAADWTGQTWAARMDHAASLLFCHGYITGSQREKITRKLEKQLTDGIASGEIVSANQDEV